jgi:hypothetical protein
MNIRSKLDRARTRVRQTATRSWRALPIPAATRHRLAAPVVWRRRLEQVPTERILLGGQNGHTAEEYADWSGDLTWGSRRVLDGPHAELLRRSTQAELTDQDILDSDYGAMARACIKGSGHYFGAVDDAGIVRVARDFLDHDDDADNVRKPAQSAPDTPVLLAPVRGSGCFQVVDGHHRVAARGVAGDDLVPARIRRTSVTTPLQDLLDRMSWIGGQRELYQPVSAPELEDSWTTVRRCRDRLDSMDKLLADVGVVYPESTYLDVASCYGWFVAEMTRLGFTATGLERDPLARRLGPAIYDTLRPEQIVTGDAVEFLSGDAGPWDVVSCFSLLHHFVLGRGSVDEVELFRLLDRATGRVLFIDTGQSHEAWFRKSLAGWDADYVGEFLERHGTFDQVIDLGPDQDDVPPYEENYGRHLFACIRNG